MASSTRRPVIAGNWKMHLTVAESVALAAEIQNRCGRFRDVDVIVAPTALAVHAVAKRLADGPVAVAAQHCHGAESGAFTGEISPPQVAAAGARYCIIGHSERRQLFGETDAAVAGKVRALLDHGLTPIVCVGESLAERDAGQTLAVVDRQVRAALAPLTPAEVPQIILAYEPIWAIGTGRTATPAQAQDVHGAVRALVARLVGEDAAAALRIQYGGSVKPDNIRALMEQPDIDGALVGGASLTADSFTRIVARGEEP
ncbi:MAG: triose-phosphate isomerase [bacterium]